MKSILQRCLTSTIAFTLISLSLGGWNLEAQSARPKVQKSYAVKKLPLRAGTTAPGGRRRGGVYRDDCPEVTPDLTALAPDYPTEQTVAGQTIILSNVWGPTSVDRPTFWFYVPYTQATSSATFSIVDDETKASLTEDQRKSLEEPVILPTQPGIVRVTLPKTAASLAIGKSYRWYFKVICKAQKSDQPQKTSAPIYVEGVVTRILPQQTEITWYDDLNTVAEMLQKNPQDADAINQWKKLLEEIQLNELADKPLLK